MGANNHPTVDVGNEPEAKANRLASALQQCDDVSEATVNTSHTVSVYFKLADEIDRISFPSSVMSILSDYNANLSGGCLEGTVWSGLNGWRATFNNEH
jgi:hypothetical protein